MSEGNGRIVFCFPQGPGRRLNDSMREIWFQARLAGHEVVELHESPHDRCRGMLTAKALETGAEWQVWCDDDQVGTIDQAIGLIATAEQVGADLMTGVYVCRHLAATGAMAMNFWPLVGGQFSIGDGGGPYPIVNCGLGFCAIRSSLFGKVQAPAAEYGPAWYLPEVIGGRHAGEDRSFGTRAHQSGCQLYVDTRVLVGHEGFRVFWPQDWQPGAPQQGPVAP
jgi:hypothetical protein